MNIFRLMVMDEDVLEKEEYYILDRIREFVNQDDVNKLAAAKQLMILIERAVRQLSF